MGEDSEMLSFLMRDREIKGNETMRRRSKERNKWKKEVKGNKGNLREERKGKEK